MFVCSVGLRAIASLAIVGLLSLGGCTTTTATDHDSAHALGQKIEALVREDVAPEEAESRLGKRAWLNTKTHNPLSALKYVYRHKRTGADAKPDLAASFAVVLWEPDAPSDPQLVTSLCGLIWGRDGRMRYVEVVASPAPFRDQVRALAATNVGPTEVEVLLGRTAWTNSKTDKKLKVPLYGIYYTKTELNAYPDFDAALAVVLWETDDPSQPGKGLSMCGLIWGRDGSLRYCEVLAFHP